MLLTIENLTVRYGSETVLNIDQPIHIEEGERIGIIGSNGAGKTTLVKSILGLVPYQGTIQTALTRDQIAVHMQFNEYADSMPVKYIMEAILETKISKNKKLQELIEYFEFGECLKKRYTKLSGGQKQRFTIILVMMQEAPLTFYDEVTSGLDFETRQKLMEKLTNWYRNKNSSLCIVSHYYDELENLVDKLLLLDKGKVIAYGKTEELFRRYCGRAVIILDNTPENETLVNDYKRLAAPAHLIALSCDNESDERELTSRLLTHNKNYKRSSRDIEILSINAKKMLSMKSEGISYDK